jgi:hypothetical protein
MKEIRMTRIRTTLGGAAVALAVVSAQPVEAQIWTQREFPLAPANSSGNFVAPYFDGWFENPDGTFTLSFGFMNRNEEDLIEIPLGPNNFIEPAIYDGNQPTSFPVVSYGGFGGPRERGTFGVVVPADFEGDVWWTLTTGDFTTKVPGRLWSPGQIIRDAYKMSLSPQAEGSMRPAVRFSENGETGIGPVGVWAPETYRTRVGEPIHVTLWAYDRDENESELRDVNMTLWKHQGPVGAVISFVSEVEPPPPPPPPAEADSAAGAGGRGGGAPGGGGLGGRGGGQPNLGGPVGPLEPQQSVRVPLTGTAPNQAKFAATFDMPGEYVIRVRIDNFTSGDSSMGNQCCWTNGFVRVVVTE